MSAGKVGFTISAIVVLIAFAIASDSYWNPLTDAWRQWLGFAPKNLLDFQWQRLFTSLVLTAGEWKFIASVLMFAVCVGRAEVIFGTRQTVRLFLVSHLTVLIAFSAFLLIGALVFQWDWATRLSTSRDIGPSAGYYGCLGAILTRWSFKVSIPSFVLIAFVLIGRLIVSALWVPNDPSVVSADVAHLIALPLGTLLAASGFVRPVRDASSNDEPSKRESTDGESTGSKRTDREVGGDDHEDEQNE